jgi:tetratricopeptide (TPR) repeat protein
MTREFITALVRLVLLIDPPFGSTCSNLAASSNSTPHRGHGGTLLAFFYYAAPICLGQMSGARIDYAAASQMRKNRQAASGSAKRIICGEGRRVKWTICFAVWLGMAGCVVSGVGQTRPVPDARRETALALEQQGKNQEAEAAWHAVLNAHPGNPEPVAHIGLLEARQGRYKEAVSYYRKALAINPNVPGLRLNLGLALFKAGALKESIPEFEMARKGAPANSADADRITILIGMAYYGVAAYDKAAPYLKEASERDPNNLQLLLALEHSYLWSNQFKFVLGVYHQILTLNPDSAEADMVAGEALDEMQDSAGATEMFRAAVKADPKLPNVHFGLGYLLWTQKQYPEAASEFKAELANDPKHVQSMLYLGDAYIQMNQVRDAGPLLEAAIKIDPSLALGHLDLGITDSEAGRNEDALRELTAAEKMMPNDVNVHWRLARLYRTLGKKDEAKAEFAKASTLNKEADEALYKKISNGSAHPSQGQRPGSTPPVDK